MIANWFPKKKGIVLGFTTMGMNVASATIPVALGSVAGWYTLPLNFNVPAGNGYRILCTFTASVSAATVGVNYAKRGANKVTEFAAKYDLSKRTNVNFSAGKQTIDLGNQYRLSVQHNF